MLLTIFYLFQNILKKHWDRLIHCSSQKILSILFFYVVQKYIILKYKIVYDIVQYTISTIKGLIFGGKSPPVRSVLVNGLAAWKTSWKTPWKTSAALNVRTYQLFLICRI